MPEESKITDIASICTEQEHESWGSLLFLELDHPFERKRIMRVISLTILLFLAFTLTTTAQTPECNPCTFEWNAPLNMAGITQYRLYVSTNSGQYDFSDPVITVPVTSTSGLIVSTNSQMFPGTWYAVVTSANGTIQSGPSNEVEFNWQFGPDQAPTGLRINIVVGANLDVEELVIEKIGKK